MKNRIKLIFLIANLKNRHYRKYRIADNKWFNDRYKRNKP